MALDKKHTEERTPQGHEEEWTEVYRCSVIWLVIGDVYTVITEGFFGFLGLGGLIIWALNLLSLGGIRFWPNETSLHCLDGLGGEPVGQRLLAIVLLVVVGVAAGAFTWWGLKGAWASLLDIVLPAATYQGELQRIRVQTRVGIHGGGWNDWILTVDGRAWVIQRTKSESRKFETELVAGKEIRVRYLRGGSINRLWVKSNTKVANHHRKLRDSSQFLAENVQSFPDARYGSTRKEGAALVRV